MKRILIADDHVAIRSGLRAILEARAGWEVVAEVCDGRRAVAAAIDHGPEVAILDHSMPLMTGIDATRHIKEHRPSTEVLIFTAYDTNELASLAFQAGASAFLAKSNSNKILLSAVESLLAHRPFFFGVFSNELQGGATVKRERGQLLTLREKTVVKMVAEGYSNKDISRILNLSIKTTETHRAVAMRKLGISSTAGLVRYAIRSNFLVA